MCSVNKKIEQDNLYGYISQSFIQLLNTNDNEHNSSDANTAILMNSDYCNNKIILEGNELIIGVNACFDDLVKLKNLIDESDCVGQHMLMTELKKNKECKEIIQNNLFVGDEQNVSSDAGANVEAKIGSFILAHCASFTCRNNVTETHDNEEYHSNYYDNILKDEKSGIEFRVEIDIDHANEDSGNAPSQNDDNDNDSERQTLTHEEAERFQRKLQNTTEPLRNCMQQLQFRENVEYSEQAEIEVIKERKET